MYTLYEVVVRPLSVFGTPLAGDTLFGHLAWQFAYDESLLNRQFSAVIEEYTKRPFLVVSSALPRIVQNGAAGYAARRPDLSLFISKGGYEPRSRRQKLEERKEHKKRKWFFIDESLAARFSRDLLLTEAEVALGVVATMDGIRWTQAERAAKDGFLITSERTHNSINRLTSTTGEGFAPFTQQVVSYLPGMTLSIFVLADDEIVEEKDLAEALRRIGSFGFGRDASSGLGRFDVATIQVRENISFDGCSHCYTLAPCLPGRDEVGQGWLQPLTRFGKHGGGAELKSNPFKNPVIMAEEGAVFRLAGDAKPKPFLGSGLTGVSKVIPETVMQAYAPCLPCNVEV